MKTNIVKNSRTFSIEPSLNRAYALISEDVSQRSCPFPALGGKGEPLAIQFNRGQPNKGKKLFIKCDHCGRGGHAKKECYWMIGHPAQLDNHKKAHDVESKRKGYSRSTDRKPYNSHLESKSYDSHFEIKITFATNNVMIERRKSYVTKHGALNNPGSSASMQASIDA